MGFGWWLRGSGLVKMFEMRIVENGWCGGGSHVV